MTAAKIYSLCTALGEGTETKGYSNINFYKAKAVYITRVIENVEKINALYNALLESDFAQIERTESGGIAKHNIKHAYGAYDVKEITTASGHFKGIIVTVLVNNHIFVFKCGLFTVKDKNLNGFKTFKMFKSLCHQNGKNLEQWAISNGEEIKEEIPKTRIAFNPAYMRKRLSGCNHIDYNHAWCAGFLKSFPEFSDEMQTLLSRDKVLPSIFLGFCQSEYAGYRFSHFAKAGIKWCNNELDKLSVLLKNADFDIVGYNTDGIWYIDTTGQGRVYHDENERPGLGFWRNDHINCDLRAYSDGQYWFIENGIFNARARGFYQYEQEKPREEWDEYDFDKAMSCETSVKFIRGRGFIIHKCRND